MLQHWKDMAWYNDILGGTVPPPVSADCGEWCSAFTYLTDRTPFVLFSMPNFQSGMTFVYEANEAVWQHVQCMSVTDSSSTTRSCCACADPNLCPFTQPFAQTDAGYCHGPCTEGPPAARERCKQLAASCGASVFDVVGRANLESTQSAAVGGAVHESFFAEIGRAGGGWDAHATCDKASIASGQCQLCTRPLWCDDAMQRRYRFGYGGRIDSPAKWLDEFYDRDGGRALGARQCKYQRGQRSAFVDTMVARFERYSQLHGAPAGEGASDHANLWNEVTLYTGPGDDGLAHDLFENLIGLVYVRNLDAGAGELAAMRRLAAHWRALLPRGRDVPLFAINAEPISEIDASLSRLHHWRPHTRIDLEAPPYSLEQIAP